MIGSLPLSRWLLMLALGVAGGLLLIAVRPLASKADDTGCADTNACLWKDNDYSNCKKVTDSDIGDFAGKDWNAGGCQSGNINDNVSSLKNRGVCHLRVYADAQQGGHYITFDSYLNPPPQPTYQDPNLSNGGGAGGAVDENWNDRISSLYFINC